MDELTTGDTPELTKPSLDNRKMNFLVAFGVLALVSAGTATALALGLSHSTSSSSSSSTTQVQQVSSSSSNAAAEALQDSLSDQLPCCVALGSRMQLRYAKPGSAAAAGGVLDFALVGGVPQHSWMAWGPAAPKASDRLMGGADVSSGGISDLNEAPWAADLFLSSYAPCDTSDPPSGTCPDTALNLNPSTGAKLSKTPAGVQALDNVKLLSGSYSGGITVVKMQRPLAASDVLDHKIDPNAPLNYIWAHGELSPPDDSTSKKPLHPSLRLQQHEPGSYGAVRGLKLSTCPTNCPKLTPAADTQQPTKQSPPAAATAAASATTTAPPAAAAGVPKPGLAVPVRKLKDCSLKQEFELRRLGDGWCDAGAAYNTAGCAYDGGDCCNKQAPFYDCRDPSSPLANTSSPRGLLLPAPRNPRYTAGLGRTLSTKELVTTWNNFYEFTTGKDVHNYVSPGVRAAMELSYPGFTGWTVTVDGMVARPLKMDVRQLINMFHIEERVYRHRCVETWAIVVPWIGFPLRKLLDVVQPLPGARYVRFETDAGTYMPNVAAPGGLGGGTPAWPYVEGLTLQEAMNDLAFLSVGQFNATLLAQSGAPIRLNVPWKYGFKSVKSLRKISLVADQPVNYWKAFSPDEYGFWANINPRIPHRRWSQAQEQLLIDSSVPAGYAKTLPYNNYTEEVAYMYPDPITAAADGNRTFFY